MDRGPTCASAAGADARLLAVGRAARWPRPGRQNGNFGALVEHVFGTPWDDRPYGVDVSDALAVVDALRWLARPPDERRRLLELECAEPTTPEERTGTDRCRNGSVWGSRTRR